MRGSGLVVAGVAVAGVLGFFLLPKILFNIFGLVISLIVWAIIGNLAGQFLRGKGYGLFGNILLGIAGGFTGSVIFWILRLGAIASIPILGSIITGVVGAVIFVFVLRLIDSNFAR